MIIIMAAVLGILACHQNADQKPRGDVLQLTVALSPAPYAGAIAVADERGFFKQAGVEVTQKYYPSGAESLQAVLKGEAQIATISDIAFAFHMRKNPSVRVVASLGVSMASQIIARKDRNIQHPRDLKGKRIGYSPGTSGDYYFHAFLLINGLSRDEVRAVAIPPERQVEAVVNGEVDAVAAFDKYSFAARKQLGNNAVAWDSQNNVAYQWLLVTLESQAQSPEAIKRMLKAMIKAEDFILNHEDEAKSIIARKWKLDPEYVDYSWNKIRNSISFNQSIVTALQTYEKWQMEKEGGAQGPPDVLPYLYPEALREADPKLVTVFR